MNILDGTDPGTEVTEKKDHFCSVHTVVRIKFTGLNGVPLECFSCFSGQLKSAQQKRAEWVQKYWLFFP